MKLAGETLAKVQDNISKDATVIRFSFDSHNYRTRCTYTLFASLTSQLLETDPVNFRYIQHLYDLVMEMDSPWTLENLWMLVRSIILISNVRPVYCFIDSVNKCDPERDHFLKDFLRLPDSTDGNLKIVITNSERDAKNFPSDFIVDVDARQSRKGDMEQYLNHKISKLIKARPGFRDSALVICERILALEPTYLLASLIIDWLYDSKARSTPSEVQKVLDDMPQSLAGIYQQAYIKNRPGSCHWNLRALYWIAHALRPLTIEELATALAIEFKEGAFTIVEENRPRSLVEDLKRTFGSFLKFDRDEVFLVHESAREFLLQSSRDWDPEIMKYSLYGHACIASLCLDYLLNANWEGLASLTSDELLATLPPPEGTSSLFLYAAEYWYVHCRLAEENPSLREKVRHFLVNEERRTSWSQVEWYAGNRLSRRREISDPFITAAELGLDDVLLSMVYENFHGFEVSH